MLESLTNPVIQKSDILHLLLVQKVPTVEDVSRPLHSLVQLSVFQSLESLPLSKHDDGIGPQHCLLRALHLFKVVLVRFLPKLVPLDFVDELSITSTVHYQGWFQGRIGEAELLPRGGNGRSRQRGIT